MIHNIPVELLEEFEGEGEDGKKKHKEATGEMEFIWSEWGQFISANSALELQTALVAFWNSHVPETITPPPELG